jgi:crotonobetainyl-CoA:carnitine CoA-transferase CaiB-like acyl-CoA transferase
MSQALEGIRIIDLTEYLAGPYCSMILADLGAEVVKVEQPGRGDGSRQWGPPFLGGESAYYLSVNRNKRSLALNLKSDKGRSIFYRLSSTADVFIENFRPGIAQKLGVDYATLSKHNDRLVYCSISGFGQNGPYANKPLYDIIGQGVSGLMSITGEKGRPPVKVGIAISDICGGMFAAVGILAGIAVREKTGRGQRIDISIMDGLVSWLSHQAGGFLATGVNPERLGSSHPTIAPYQAFKASDSYFVVAVGNDALWSKFCEALYLNELFADERFHTNPERVKHREELAQILGDLFVTKPASEWIERIEARGVPCGPVHNLSDVFNDPQVLYRKMINEVQHPSAGTIKVVGVPIKMSDTPGSVRTHPPMLGEHTNQILNSLGYTDTQIADLRKEGVIG